VLEWLRALGLHWPPLPAKVWATRDIQCRRHTRCIVSVIAWMNGLLTYRQPGDHIFMPGSRLKRWRRAIFIQYGWKMMGCKVIRIRQTSTEMQLTILYREKEKRQSSEVMYRSLKGVEDRETRWCGGWGIFRGTVEGEVLRILESFWWITLSYRKWNLS